MNKLELIKTIKEIEIDCNYESVYNDIYNACIKYKNETGDWSLDYFFDEYVSAEEVENNIKKIMNNNEGLYRLHFFLGDTDLRSDVFIINGYGNLENINRTDLECLKYDILNELENEEN